MVPDGAGGFVNPVEVGVCSRNQLLRVVENSGNNFVSLAVSSGILSALESMVIDGEGEYAVQGELMGPGVQKNRENLKHHKFYIFDVQDIATGRYLDPEERYELFAKLKDRGINTDLVDHVPVLHRATTLAQLGITNVKELLAYADGVSIFHPIREGLVFKRLDAKFSFKAVSNLYLAKEKD